MDKKANICLVVQNYYDIDPRVRRKAESLAAAGYRVHVLALPPSKDCRSPYPLKGVKVFCVGLVKKRSSILRYVLEYIWFYLAARRKLWKLHREFSYDVVDINTIPDFLVFITGRLKREGVKVVLDMHEAMPEFYQSKYAVPASNMVIRLLKWQEKRSVEFADHMLTIHKPMQRIFEARGLDPDRTTVIANSAEEEPFLSYVTSETGKRDRFIYMYHGTLTKLYSLDDAVMAFAGVADQMLQAEFWIVGDGPERHRLAALIAELDMEERVKLHGRVPKDEIPQWLSQCDVGVLPTRQDIYTQLSFSNKLPEYIIMRKPVISSRLKAIRHFFGEESLLYFEPGNTDELADMLLKAYKEPAAMKHFVERALIDYQQIRWPVMRERYLGVIRDLLVAGSTGISGIG
jgi:glycosyltransferase involved in cell wall biosynthesis